MKTKHLIKTILVLPLLSLMACSETPTEQESMVVSRAIKALGCQNFESELFNGIYDHLLIEKKRPRNSSVQAFIDAQVALKVPNWSHEKKTELSKELKNIYSSLLNLSVRQIVSSNEVSESEQQTWLSFYASVEIGDQTSTRKKLVKKDLSLALEKVKALTAGESCSQRESSFADIKFNSAQVTALNAGESLAVLGGRWAFATAYQSCRSAELPAMSKETEALEGVSVVGKHSDGVGSKRVISNLGKVLQTHYYLQNDSYEAKCIDVRKNPLIYDYGGKPFIESTSGLSSLNFFKNAGDGTGVLGIDCSGFVFSALASSGLRLGINKPLKAVNVYGVGSTMYLDPRANGLTCFDKVTLTPSESLKNGDIVAVQGHVVMLDDVSSDPFGLESTTKIQDCSAVTASKFQFTVMQSSPSKSGIGINRYRAADYLAETPKLRAGLERYAYFACLAKYQAKNIQPNLSDLSVVRHHGTQECMDKRVPLVAESCIEQCSFVAH